MKLNYFVILLISLGCSTVYAQKKGSYSARFNEGNLLFNEGNYPMALNAFNDAYAIDSSSANINYLVGMCYLYSASEKTKAVKYLQKAADGATKNYMEFEPREKGAPIESYYYLGKAYHLSNNFDMAVVYYEKYKQTAGSRKNIAKELDRELETCYTALELVRKPLNVRIEELGDSINTVFPEYSAVLSADESTIIFTSRRTGSTGNVKTTDDKFYEDIYISTKRPDGTWSKAVSISANINTPTNEASVGLSADGQTLFIFKDVNEGDIYYSKLDGEKWSTPRPLESNINSSAWETHATISADGNTIYFTSNRKGGQGGRDIYRCVKLPNGEWSMALNLGPEINTPFDEDAPYIHPDGTTLYFSSNGHKTMGGFDIFHTTRNEDNKWNTPVNLGYPINTTDDDIFYVSSADGKRAYYSSSKIGGKGDKDIYQITLSDIGIEQPVTLMKGYLTFNGGDKIPTGVKITVTDVETGAVVQEVRPNSKTGKYVMILSPGQNGKVYAITYEAEGFQPMAETIKIDPTSRYQEIQREVELNAINLESKTLGTISMSGNITNTDGNPIPNAKILVTDNKTGNVLDTVYSNASNGAYYFVLDRGKNYNISYEAEGYLFQTENINVPKEPLYSENKNNIVLERVKAGAKIVLNNIFFDNGKSNLKPESMVELDKLLKFMNENKDIIIEVSGHTDNKGNDKANLALSKSRAQAVVTHLVKKGIDPIRLIAKGYGKAAPIAPNTLPNGKPNPDGMRQNRRVELKILDPSAAGSIPEPTAAPKTDKTAAPAKTKTKPSGSKAVPKAGASAPVSPNSKKKLNSGKSLE